MINLILYVDKYCVIYNVLIINIAFCKLLFYSKKQCVW